MQRFSAAVLFWFATSCGIAQTDARLDARRITSGEFAAQRFGPARWLDGSHYATLEPAADRGALELIRYDAVTGAREVLVGKARLALPGRTTALQIEDYEFSPDGTRLLLFTDSERVWRQNTRGEYYVLELAGTAAPRRLGGALPKSTLMFAKWSPDGTRVAYVSQNDLYVEALAAEAPTRVTTGGSPTLIHGTFDWVYEEEFDCRDGFRWSPDGQRLAFWELDCSGVGEFLMIDNLSDRYSKVVPVQFPKAGTTNSACRIGVVSAAGGDVVWMQTPGDPRETYLPRMEWHPKGEELMVQWLPRQQNHLVVYGADAVTGAVRVVHEERDPAYVDVREDFRWVEQGERFFWTSDVAFTGDGVPKSRQCGTIVWDTRGKQVLVTHLAFTRGFDVIDVVHADLERGQLYVSGSPDNATQKHMAKVSLEGGKTTWLREPATDPVRPAPGWEEFAVSPDGSLAIRTASSFGVPPVVSIVRLPSLETVRTLVDNQALQARWEKVEKGRVEFFQVSGAAGHALDGWMLYPPAFDATKRWPVLFHVYGEPASQTVKDTWLLGHHLFHRWLVQLGYVVVSIDARGTPAPKGRDWRKALYQQIGVLSTADWQHAVVDMQQRFSWIDPNRQAVWGWSGGGAMTLNLLFRCPDLFAAGMSVAPVTDIGLYDTIYQERYCGDPRQVPEVYRRCSPIHYAAQLKAQLLLVHGTGDDNVHFQHSERLFDALVGAGKLFEYLAYPNRTHSIHEGKGTRQHLYAALADFLQRRVPAGPR